MKSLLAASSFFILGCSPDLGAAPEIDLNCRPLLCTHTLDNKYGGTVCETLPRESIRLTKFSEEPDFIAITGVTEESVRISLDDSTVYTTGKALAFGYEPKGQPETHSVPVTPIHPVLKIAQGKAIPLQMPVGKLEVAKAINRLTSYIWRLMLVSTYTQEKPNTAAAVIETAHCGNQRAHLGSGDAFLTGSRLEDL